MVEILNTTFTFENIIFIILVAVLIFLILIRFVGAAVSKLMKVGTYVIIILLIAYFIIFKLLI